jgi:hypothetical protein
MNLKRPNPRDIEIEVAAQKFLLGWKATGQPINIESKNTEATNDSVKKNEEIVMTGNSEQKSVLPKVSNKERNKETHEIQSEKSLDGLLSLANSLTKA